MASVLVCSCPVTGHVVPMLAVAAGLVNRGRTVLFLAGQRFAERVVTTGATFLPLPPEADFDETKQDEDDLTNIFMRPVNISAMPCR